MVLRFQTITLLVAAATLVLTVVLYIFIPKGFFPVQDTGVIQGISQASQSISFDAMSEKQRELAQIILQDPAVESLSSFIGADGINTTLNSGRISINLKPINERIGASDVIRRLQHNLNKVQGIHLYMQPVQDITVDDRVSRTQYQYTLEDPDTDELNEWTNKFVAQLKKLPELEDVATDQQTGAKAVQLEIDRVTASRLGIAPTTIDNTLYDAYGQREISTLYTQLNQYHVILETAPEWQQNPTKLGDLYIQTSASSGATGAGAATSYSSSASASAGSNATTTSVRYTPSSQVLTSPASVLAGGSSNAGASSPSGGSTRARRPMRSRLRWAPMPFRSAPSRKCTIPPRRFPSTIRDSSLRSRCRSTWPRMPRWERRSPTLKRRRRTLTSLPACSPISRALLRRSRIHSPTKRCSFSPLWSPSTSFLASCMRASSIRLPLFPRCPRPVWVHCSRS